MKAFENFPNIKILNFFDINIDLEKYVSKAKLFSKKYVLKSFSSILNEEEFAKIYMAYNEKGLYFIFDVKTPFTKAFFPEYQRADSIEVFIDTRSLKTKGYITKFCHHFVFFAEDIKGYKAREITRFRADDMHAICGSKDLKVDSIVKPKSYMLDIHIPSFCLTGFNPIDINYLSFTYRINRYQMPPQNFSVSSNEHVIEKSPHLWAKMNLLK
ncbi:MAG: hypothetical protein K1060chlam1_01108 [Candidatus Anoxychlamydiales bacterium]|nr:hypothetical protein [Candidatus Anoxychlamydiales bacterium]